MQSSIFHLYIEMPAVKDWLHRCYSRGFAHGGDLVESWRIADNVSQSCRVLDALVDRGWLTPCEAATPTREQVFFGVGGRRPGINTRGQKWRASHTYSIEFGYEPNLDCGEFMEWIRKPTPTSEAERA